MRDTMKLAEIIEPDFSFADERGLLVQIAHEGVAQVNAVFTKKGAVRGRFHYHKAAKEQFFVISGKLKLEVFRDNTREEYVFGRGEVFLIPPLVRHNFIYLEDTLLVLMYDKCVENDAGTKDIYSD